MIAIKERMADKMTLIDLDVWMPYHPFSFRPEDRRERFHTTDNARR